MANPVTRVTLIGARRHVDLLLPSAEPVGTLVPQILHLLGDQPKDEVAAKVLVTPDGSELSDSVSLAEAGVADGAALTLHSSTEAPPAPVVYDITDTVVMESGHVAGRWTARWRDVAAGAFAAAGVWAAAMILLPMSAGEPGWWILLVPAGCLLVLAAGLGAGKAGPAPIGATVAGTGWLLGASGIAQSDWPLPQQLLLLAVLTAFGLVALGFVAGKGRAFFSAAAILTLLALIWTGSAFFAGSGLHTAAMASVASILVLGLLPRIALSSSGLASLDDQRAHGTLIGRRDALAAIAAAHHALALGTVVCAISIAAGLWLLGGDTGSQVWTLPLLLALALAAFLRAQSFPLAVERIALYLAAATGVAALAQSFVRFAPELFWLAGIGVLLTAVVIGAMLVLRLPGHVLARFRVAAKRFETLAILATIPLLAGLFGLFAQLLETF